MVLLPGCQCAECVARWVADLTQYAIRLERGALSPQTAFDAGDTKTALAFVKAAAILAGDRDLQGEIEASAEEYDARRAVEERQAGRLH